MNELQIWICQENIERFHAQLTRVGDEGRRRTIAELLTQERNMLRNLTQAREEARVFASSAVRNETKIT